VIEIRQVRADDWSVVREVRLTALRDTPDWFWSTYEEEADKPESWWRSFIDAGAWFIASAEGRLVGIAAAIGDSDLGDSTRQLVSMWVDPDARRRGVGTKLVEAVKAWTTANGVNELQLQVTENNHAAARLYEECGFTRTGRTQALPRNPSLVEHEMRLRL
jgi:GNAT superfamily N-acetyltransferase